MGKINKIKLKKLRAKRNRIKGEIEESKGKSLKQLRKERKKLDDKIWNIIGEGHREKIEEYVSKMDKNAKINDLLSKREKAHERMKKAKEEGKFQEMMKIRTKLDEIKNKITDQLVKEGEILDLSGAEAKKEKEQERPTKRRSWSGARKEEKEEKGKKSATEEEAEKIAEWEIKKEKGIRKAKTPSKVEDVIVAKAKGLIEDKKAKGENFKNLKELKEAIQEEIPKSKGGKEPYLSIGAIGNIINKRMQTKPQLKKNISNIKESSGTKTEKAEKEEIEITSKELEGVKEETRQELSEEERRIKGQENIDRLVQRRENLKRKLNDLKEANSNWSDRATAYQQKQVRAQKRREIRNELRKINNKISTIRGG